MARKRRAWLIVALLAAPAVAWGAFPAAVAEAPGEVSLRVPGNRPFEWTRDWTVNFTLPGPGWAYDLEPELRFDLRGAGGPRDAAEARIDFQLLVNGQTAGSMRTLMSSGGTGGVAGPFPDGDEWTERALRRGPNSVTFRVTVDNDPSPQVPGHWTVELGPARVGIHGAP